MPIALLLSKKCVNSVGRTGINAHKNLIVNNIPKSLIFFVFAPYYPSGGKNEKYGRVACQDYSSSNTMMVGIFSTPTYHFFDSQKGGR